MSRVHINFFKTSIDGSSVNYDVISPDFSNNGWVEEIIGILYLNPIEKIFRYEATERLKKDFCPPEFFEIYSGDWDKVREACEREGYMCSAWSHFIYKKAKELIKLNIFPERADTGLEPESINQNS